ncbi:MAG: hypothetical protein ACK501_06380 [Planctomycetota bacterium]|jgi:hypothetical protein
MEREHHAEWQELRARATDELRRGAATSLRRGQPHRLVQVLVLPSFAPSLAYEVFCVPSVSAPTASVPEAFVAIRTCWDQPADLACFATPVERLRHARVLQPTMVRRQGTLAAAEARALVADLANLQLPLAPGPASFGLDGTRNELMLDAGSAEATVRWWERPPANWAAAAALAERVVAWVEAVVR